MADFGRRPGVPQVDLIREVFLYAHRYRGNTFVIQIDSAVLLGAGFADLVQDLALLHQAGISIVLVPGAGRRIDEVLERYQVPYENHRGLRIAGEEAIPFIKMAAFDTANRAMTGLSAWRIPAVIGNWVRARAVGVLDGVDYQEAGQVERLQLDLVRRVLADRFVPIFPCIGWSPTGRPYNISSRELAARLATDLQAEKLFFLAQAEHIDLSGYDLPDDVPLSARGAVSRMRLDEVANLMDRNARMRHLDSYRLLELSHRAAAAGVHRVHLLDGELDGVILKEIFSTLGYGTMIHANEFASLRPMAPEDVPAVLRVMRPWVERGALVPRTEEQLRRDVDDYVVFETDGRVHGCAALHVFSPAAKGSAAGSRPAGGDSGAVGGVGGDGLSGSGDSGAVGEIAAVAVDTAFEEMGIGRKLVRFLLNRAAERRLRRAFILTTQTLDWFEQLGFRPGTVDDLPQQRRETYNPGRRSRVLLFDIAATDAVSKDDPARDDGPREEG